MKSLRYVRKGLLKQGEYGWKYMTRPKLPLLSKKHQIAADV